MKKRIRNRRGGAFAVGKVECLLCKKKYFHCLGTHLRMVHQITADDYRQEFDILFGQSLNSETLTQKKRDISIEGGHFEFIKDYAQEASEKGARVPKRRTKQHIAKSLAILKGKAPRGEQHGHVTLTENDVRQIMKGLGHMTQKELGNAYNVCPGTISNIKRGVTWGHVTNVRPKTPLNKIQTINKTC